MAKPPIKRPPVNTVKEYKIDSDVQTPPKSSWTGAPTHYRPEHCESIIEFGKSGMSPAQIASALGVARTTLYHWANTYPEFARAMEIARTHELAWWETVGQSALYAEKFQGSVWYKSISNRFKDDYADRFAAQVTGADNGPIKTETTNSVKLDVAAMPPEARDAIREAIKFAKESQD